MRKLTAFRTKMTNDQGLTTAEYAMGTVAAAGMGGVLIKILTSDGVRDVIWNLIQRALSSFFS